MILNIIVVLLFVKMLFIILIQRYCIKKISKNFIDTTLMIDDVKFYIDEFYSHLESFNNVDIYNSDPMVEDLIAHCGFVKTKLEETKKNIESKITE